MKNEGNNKDIGERKIMNVIIPTTGKRLVLLEECIKSLGKQSQKVKITVVLGTIQPALIDTVKKLCTRNKSKLLIESYKDIRGSKRAVACNYGIENTKSEFIGFVDDDVTVPETWAETLLKHFENPKVAGVTSGCNPDDSVFHKVQQIGSDSHSKNFKEVIEIQSVPGYNSIYRRSAINAVGNFSEEIGGCEDWELNYRLRGVGWILLGIPKVSVEHRHTYTQQSFIKQMIGYGWSRSRLLRKKRIFTPIHALPTIGMFVLPILLFLNYEYLIFALSFCIIGLSFLTLHVGVSGIKDFFNIFITFIMMYVSWGYGYLKGLIR